MKRFQNTATWVWLTLVAATGLTYWVGEHNAGHALGTGAVCLVFGLACVKGWLVIDVFMGLRNAPKLWRWLLLGWLMVVLLVLATTVALTG